MGSLLRSKVVIVCLAVLTSLVGVCSPRVRAFAAAGLSGIHSTRTDLTHSGPIPYILDLSKHNPHHKAAPKAAPARTSTSPAKSPARTVKPVKPAVKVESR